MNQDVERSRISEAAEAPQRLEVEIACGEVNDGDRRRFISVSRTRDSESQMVPTEGIQERFEKQRKREEAR
jgi:hypothetical protein